MYPSIKTIQTGLNIDRKTAIEIRKLMDGRINPDNYKSVESWVNQCYSEPSNGEKIMCALNELLGAHGIEAIDIEGHHTDNYWGSFVGEYINMGDTYTTTIVYLSHNTYYTPGFKICSWGNIVERYN